MSLQTITGKRVGDTYYKLEHPSGLTVFIYPKENSNSTYAVFGTKYGSVDNQFRCSDEDTVHTVPEGIAHFWSTNYLKVKTEMLLHVMQKQALPLTRILPLI